MLYSVTYRCTKWFSFRGDVFASTTSESYSSQVHYIFLPFFTQVHGYIPHGIKGGRSAYIQFFDTSSYSQATRYESNSDIPLDLSYDGDGWAYITVYILAMLLKPLSSPSRNRLAKPFDCIIIDDNWKKCLVRAGLNLKQYCNDGNPVTTSVVLTFTSFLLSYAHLHHNSKASRARSGTSMQLQLDIRSVASRPVTRLTLECRDRSHHSEIRRKSSSFIHTDTLPKHNQELRYICSVSIIWHISPFEMSWNVVTFSNLSRSTAALTLKWTFGWKNLVTNLTSGGTRGYCDGILKERVNMPAL